MTEEGQKSRGKKQRKGLSLTEEESEDEESDFNDTEDEDLADVQSHEEPPPHVPAQHGQVNYPGTCTRPWKRRIISTCGRSFTVSPSTPTPTNLSTAFGGIHLSPDLSRAQTNSN